MKNRSGSALIIILIVIAMAAIGGLAYWALRPKRQVIMETSIVITPKATPSPSTGQNTYSNTYFTFDIPAGWSLTQDATTASLRTFEFTNSSNDYLLIKLFTGGGDVVADSFWGYRLEGSNPKSITITSEEPDCDPQGMCKKGDGALELALTPAQGQSIAQTTDGKYFYMELGNTKDENADRAKYREILKGLRLNTQ